MIRAVKRVAAATALALVLAGGTAAAQKTGGVLRVHVWDSPANLSILDGANPLAARTDDGGVQQSGHVRPACEAEQPHAIVPDLATGWSWNEDGTELTFPLRQGVKWHDGKPFTATDVKCTWDLCSNGEREVPRQPAQVMYKNLERVTTNGDYEVTFHLKRPQPAFLMLLADGFSPIYPCHVPPAQMRQHPIGTGPFKFVEFKPNE